MNFVTLKDLLPLVPEIIILFTSFIVILVDLLLLKKSDDDFSRHLTGWNRSGSHCRIPTLCTNPIGFYGTVVSDPYSILFESLYLIVAGVTVFISLHYIAEQEMNYGEYYVSASKCVDGNDGDDFSSEMLVIFIVWKSCPFRATSWWA